MRVKIEMEMSGGEYLDFLRKLSKPVATRVNQSTSIQTTLGKLLNGQNETELFRASADQIIESKKR